MAAASSGSADLLPAQPPSLQLVPHGANLRLQRIDGSWVLGDVRTQALAAVPDEFGTPVLRVSRDGWAYIVGRGGLGQRAWADPYFHRALYTKGGQVDDTAHDTSNIVIVQRFGAEEEQLDWDLYWNQWRSVFVGIFCGSLGDQKEIEAAYFPNTRSGTHLWWSIQSATAVVNIIHTGRQGGTTAWIRQATTGWESQYRRVGLPGLPCRRSQHGYSGRNNAVTDDSARCMDKLSLSTGAFLHQLVRWTAPTIQAGGLGGENNAMKAEALLDGLVERFDQGETR